MSAGPFINRFYEADSGEIHLIKQQPESAIFSIGGVANVIPAGPATSPFWVKASKGVREYGMSPRKLKFKFNSGEAPDGYQENAVHAIPVYSPAVYNGATVGLAAVYLGGTGLIVGKQSESIFPEI